MEFITENGKEYILVSKQAHVEEIVNRMVKQEPFAEQFKFSERDLFIALLESVKVNYEDFIAKYFYYDAIRKLHISESEFGHVWISTMGLVANKKTTKNRAVNSCLNQYTVVSLLFEKAIEVVQDEKVYDIDSYKSGLLSNLSPAIYHNVIFYIEVFCKAYLDLTGTQAQHTHKLTSIYQKTVEVMTSNYHNDSLFQVLVLDPLYKFVDHLGKIPGDFKEQFIKYDDNPQDDTVILFNLSGLIEMKYLLELSVDFINDYFYMGTDSHYLKSNLYQRILDKADTEEKKKRIQDMYSHLAKKIE
ncbi:hypothetical protein [Chitinophaga ginsengisegetis]|uniref:hypothetical protein n=1 Tax=Chitinophaga ginsengisegetis TaxID=393003 RepID=UPI000DBFE592|nr:hypothetical protein [Chitinophaga ginsengisegetis]MDR6569160.1 hypothetical protein [Chitinophaga ginsengisegetis]MDR6648810.1 hypothetical protein [Chitinophaga ginsengisegetis]MDR6655242.1 hypothetical protein [Chitinophaga ginsengisegetis]